MSQPSNPLAPFNDPSVGLLKVLNRHGYGFQYRALKQCVEWERPEWLLAVAEYPVELHGASTHIDFVLSAGPHLVVAECKRVEGWTWGFARGLARHQVISQHPRADFLYWENNRDKLFRTVRTFGKWDAPTYDTAVELKQYGESDKLPRALDSAIAQVLRGRGGLINDLSTRGEPRYAGGAVVPMILTTADLVVTDTNLSLADLETGDLSEIQAHKVDYVWYDHNLSAAFRPSVPGYISDGESPSKTERLQTSLALDMSRSVAIVTPPGIQRFLYYLKVCLDHSDPI